MKNTAFQDQRLLKIKCKWQKEYWIAIYFVLCFFASSYFVLTCSNVVLIPAILFLLLVTFKIRYQLHMSTSTQIRIQFCLLVFTVRYKHPYKAQRRELIMLGLAQVLQMASQKRECLSRTLQEVRVGEIEGQIYMFLPRKKGAKYLQRLVECLAKTIFKKFLLNE